MTDGGLCEKESNLKNQPEDLWKKLARSEKNDTYVGLELLKKARLDSIIRAVQYVWTKYVNNAFGAAEIDPLSGDGKFSDGSKIPYMIIDNIEMLHMIGWHSEVDRVIRWLELGTIFIEVSSSLEVPERTGARKAPEQTERLKAPEQTSFCPYCYYRNIYWSKMMGEDRNETSIDDVMDIFREEVRAFIVSEVTGYKGRHEILESLIDEYLPPLNIYSDPVYSRNVTEDLRLLKRSFGGIYNLHFEPRSSFFETTIRGLGGLLSAWYLIGHPILSYSSWNLGHRLAHNVFFCNFADGSTSCLPWRHVNLNAWSILSSELENNKCAFDRTSLSAYATTAAVVMSNQLEFAALSDMLGNCEYYNGSLETMREFLSFNPPSTGLLTKELYIGPDNVTSYQVDSPDAESDSAYEYIIKMILLDDSLKGELTPRVEHMVSALIRLMSPLGDADVSSSNIKNDSFARHPERLWLHRYIDVMDFEGNRKMAPVTSHLSCFVGGMLFLASKLVSGALRLGAKEAARQISESCYVAATQAPEKLATESLLIAESPAKLRPEIIESLYYAATFSMSESERQLYEDKIWDLTEAILSYTRQPFGFCKLSDAHATSCRQESWLIAETFKYSALANGLEPAAEHPLDRIRYASRAAYKALLNERAEREQNSYFSNCEEGTNRRNALVSYLLIAPSDPQRKFLLPVNDTVKSDTVNKLGEFACDLKLQHSVRSKKVQFKLFTTEAHLLWPLNFTSQSCSKREVAS